MFVYSVLPSPLVVLLIDVTFLLLKTHSSRVDMFSIGCWSSSTRVTVTLNVSSGFNFSGAPHMREVLAMIARSWVALQEYRCI